MQRGSAMARTQGFHQYSMTFLQICTEEHIEEVNIPEETPVRRTSRKTVDIMEAPTQN